MLREFKGKLENESEFRKQVKKESESILYTKEEVETLIREWASFTVTGRGQWWKPSDLDKWIEEKL